MINLTVVLTLLAPIFFVVGALHLILGVGAEVMLGAELSATAITDPVLDSQNRFYGTAFTLYGAVFYICATNVSKYAPILRAALWIFFAAGLARIVSIVVYGFPTVFIFGLLMTEIFLPPLLFYLLSRHDDSQS